MSKNVKLYLLAVGYFTMYCGVTFADAPVATADTRTFSLNGIATFNVTDNDYDPDGDAIFIESVTQPEFGSVVIDTVGNLVYTPQPNLTAGYIDEFTYVLADRSEEGLTSQATVTLIIQDNVYSPLAENSNDENLAAVLGSVCDDLKQQSDAELGAGQSALLAQCLTLEALQNANPDDASAVSEALTQIAPEEAIAQSRVALDANRVRSNVVSQRVQQQSLARKKGQINHVAVNGRLWQLRGAGASADDVSIWSRIGVFASFQVEDAQREKSDLENGYQADTTSVTLGGDYFLTESLLIGSTLALGQSDVAYVNSDGMLEAGLISWSAFGAYYYQDFSAYVQLGYAWLDFDSARYINYGSGSLQVSESLESATYGRQQSLNSRVEWEWQRGVLRVAPFTRMDYLRNKTEAYGEQGASGLEMSFDEHSSDQLTLAAGVQASYTLTPSWAVVVPTLGATFLSEQGSSNDAINAGFAVDPEENRRYALTGDGGDSGYYQLSLGASAVFPHGVSAFAEWTKIYGYTYLNSSQIQLGVRYEL